MVRPGGFEPPTYGSGSRRSVRLSYGRIGQQYPAVGPERQDGIIVSVRKFGQSSVLRVTPSARGARWNGHVALG